MNAAETQTYSIASNSTTTSTTAVSNVVYDGEATPTVTWGPDCIPQAPFTPPVYTPKVYNAMNSTGGWSIGNPVTGGAEFSVGTVVTIIIDEQTILQSEENQYDSGYGGELDGFEGTDDETEVIVPSFLIILQLEIAYERTTNAGPPTACHLSDSGATLCNIPQTAWCNAKGTPPDLNVLVVKNTEVLPIPPSLYFENYGICVRTGTSGTWHCGGNVLSLQNFNPAPGLGACTKTP